MRTRRGSRRGGRGSRRGAVLAVTLVLSLVLLVLSTSIFYLFMMNLGSYEFVSGRIKALAAAEAGANIALYHLSQGNGAPVGPPFSMPGDSAQWMDLPGEGMAWVVVDPFDSNSMPNMIGGVEIRSRGISGDVTRDIVVRASPDYPSRYAILVDGRVPNGFFRDGSFVDGPVHANGLVEFSSMSADSTDDPFVSAVSTSQESFYFAGAGYSDEPHPPGSSVWVRPYARHSQGAPYWQTEADSVSFGDLYQDLADLRMEAMTDGLVLTAPERIVVSGGQLQTLDRPDGEPVSHDITGVDIVYVQGGARPVYFKTATPPSQPVTFVFTGSVYIYGDVASPSTGPLSVVTMGDAVIAGDPDLTGEDDWPSPWNVHTDDNVEFHGVLAAPGGRLRAQDSGRPDPAVRFTVYGGIIQDDFGITGVAGRGYELHVAWDQDLTTRHPPGFPSLDRWKMLSWQQDPDYGELSIDDNMF